MLTWRRAMIPWSLSPLFVAFAAAVEYDRALMRWMYRDAAGRDERELSRLEVLEMAEQLERARDEWAR